MINKNLMPNLFRSEVFNQGHEPECKQCPHKYFGSELNRLKPEYCMRNMTVNNLDMITKVGENIKIIETKLKNESSMGPAQSDLLSTLSRVYKIPTFEVRALSDDKKSPFKDGAKVFSFQTGEHEILHFNNLIRFIEDKYYLK